MKQKFFTIFILTILMMSCNLIATVSPAPALPSETPPAISTSTVSVGNNISLNPVSLTIPTGLAKDALLETVSATTDPNTAPWDLAPAHITITLTGYELQNKFHEPRIFVYPVADFAQANTIAAEQIDRLKKVLAGAPALKETMPNVPFFNAGALISANVQIITFQSGRGVRELTQYGQYPAPINNHELFYHFEGLTGDGKTYVVAVLPITAPVLAEDEKPDALVPAEGIPIPTDTGPGDAYYASVTEKLVSLPPESLMPSLSKLDSLIQSIIVANP
jgi:hypothetical protein